LAYNLNALRLILPRWPINSAETLKVVEAEPIWNGLMPDYTLPTIENPYLSTLAAGLLGIIIVSAVAYALGNLMSKVNKTG